MQRPISTAVRVEVLDQEPGHWCTRCQLPSGWRAWVVVRWLDKMHLQVKLLCDQCGTSTHVQVDESRPA